MSARELKEVDRILFRGPHSARDVRFRRLAAWLQERDQRIAECRLADQVIIRDQRKWLMQVQHP
jgi:hypothetical protein